MKISKLIFSLTTCLVFITFQSCQKSDISNLQEAQFCLNKATAGTAKTCVAGIASNTTSYANSLRCSAIFISEGYGAANAFAAALETMNSPGTCTGGCSSTVSALTTFKFTSAGVTTAEQKASNNATAAEAFTACSSSGLKSYTTISSLFKIGTLTAMIVGNATLDADAIKNALTNSALSSATLGAIVTTTYASVCADTTNASAATKSYCTELNSTITKSPSTTPEAIGACLKILLANPAANCP